MTDPATKIEQESPIVEKRLMRKVWTLANGFSLARIFLLPFILYCLSRGDSLTLATILMIIAAFTDILDGYVARRYSDISQMGMILDPLADKIVIGTITAFLVVLKGFPLWLVVVVILRDIFILTGGMLLIRNKGSPIPSNVAGKLTTISLALTVLLFTGDANVWLKRSFVYLSTGLLILSSFLYLTMFVRIMRRRGPIEVHLR